MEKNKILSKLSINIKDYNNELEKILENKLFSFSVKNLLLSMLYKIENAYKDYETAKVEVPTKNEYLENLIGIIREKALKIFLVKPETPEAEELEKQKIRYKVDKENGEITCFQNELVILTALLELGEVDKELKVKYDYIKEPLNKMLNIGKIDSNIEVIRDFNGWSWDIVIKDINDIDYNFIYQNLLLLNGKDNIINEKNKEINNIIDKLVIEKYIKNKKNKKNMEDIKNIKKKKKKRLQLFENKKEFLDKITNEKKEYTKKIEYIDRILNDNELLKKEYYARNEKLPNKEKIFSVSYLVGILDKERVEFLEKIDECNKLILPKEYVEQKNKLQIEYDFLSSIKEKIERNDLIELSTEILNVVKTKINKINEENKSDLIKWIYKIRYYRSIPLNEEEHIKDAKELDNLFKEIIELIIKKAQTLKIWDVFSENAELTYKVLKEIFNTKIIKLENINIQCRYEEKTLYVEYYDDTVIENTVKIEMENVKIKKKIKLFV